MIDDKMLDEIFDDVTNIIAPSKVSRNTNYSRVTRKNVTSKSNDILPWVNKEVLNKNYLSRKEEILSNLENIEFGTYNPNKINGFNSAIKRYHELTKKETENIKNIDIQIETDLKQSSKTKNNDYFSQGYLDGLNVINNIIYRSKLSKFTKLAGNLN